MKNTITIELCQEDRERIDLLISCASGLGTELINLSKTIGAAPQTPTAPQEAPEQTAPETVHPVDEVSPHGEPEPVAEPETPKYTKDDIQSKVQSMATPGHPKRDAVKAVVQSYGKKVSDIPEDKYNEVMDKLTALEG